MVVSWNAAPYLAVCLEALRGEVARTVVVDNASHDGSVCLAAATGAEIINSGSNLGFGRAANRGVAATTAPYVLLLNPDAEVRPGAVAGMVAVLDDDPEVGVVGPRIVTRDGTTYPSARAFPSLGAAFGHGFLGLVRPRNRWSEAYLRPDRPDWVAGTAMLLRRSAFEAVGGFDEDYFMYVEDVDFCWRLGLAGWRVAVAETAVVSHVVGASSEQHPYRMIIEHHRSLWRFARRSQRGFGRVALPCVAVALAGRAVLSAVRRLVMRRAPAMH